MSELRMGAYYYRFDETGDPAIDKILSAVACAGKAYHHTENWTETDTGEWEPHKGNSPVAWIQNAANEAAKNRRADDAGRLRAEDERELKRSRDLVTSCCGDMSDDELCGRCLNRVLIYRLVRRLSLPAAPSQGVTVADVVAVQQKFAAPSAEPCCMAFGPRGVHDRDCPVSPAKGGECHHRVWIDSKAKPHCECESTPPTEAA